MPARSIPHMVTEAARGHRAYHLAVLQHRLITCAVRVTGINKGVSRACSAGRCCGLEERVTTEEISLVHRDEPRESRLERHRIGSELGAPSSVALLQTQGIERPSTAQAEAEIRSRMLERMVDRALVFDTHVEFVPEIPRECDAHHTTRYALEFHVPCTEERKSAVADVLAGEPPQELPRVRTGNGKTRLRKRDGTHVDTCCGPQVREVTHVEALGRAGADKPEERIGEPRYREITDDSAGRN